MIDRPSNLISECCFTTMFHNNGLNGLRHMEFKSLNLNKRMKWYTVIQSIGLVQWYEEQKDMDMNTWLKF